MSINVNNAVSTGASTGVESNSVQVALNTLVGKQTFSIFDSAKIKVDHVNQLQKTAFDFARFIVNRPITSNEASHYGLPLLTFNNPLAQHSYACQSYACQFFLSQDYFEKFYEAFKMRLIDLDVRAEHPDFGCFVVAAQTLLENKIKAVPGHENSLASSLKMMTEKQKFSQRIFDDGVETYALQPLANITMESYEARLAELRNFFSQIPLEYIQSAIKQKFQDHYIMDLEMHFSHQNRELAIHTIPPGIDLTTQPFLSVPFDMLAKILGFSDTSTAFKIACLVCKTWNNTLQRPPLSEIRQAVAQNEADQINAWVVKCLSANPSIAGSDVFNEWVVKCLFISKIDQFVEFMGLIPDQVKRDLLLEETPLFLECFHRFIQQKNNHQLDESSLIIWSKEKAAPKDESCIIS
jgi:hypothetical protein